MPNTGQTWVAIDQHGQRIYGNGPPRKALMSYFNTKNARRVYRDTPNGTVHTGWVVRGCWYEIYYRMDRKP